MKVKFTPKKVLITGGAGFIGANFVHYMLTTDPTVTVVVLDKLTYAGNKQNLADIDDNDRYDFYQGDICDQYVVNSIMHDHQIDTIVHFAAESHVDRSIDKPAPFIQTNVNGTFILLDMARQYWLTEQRYTADQCRFHHISTDEVFGTLTKADAAFTEQTAYAPNSPYAASKAGSDHIVRAYQHTYQLPTTITHCSNNYGPFQHSEKFIPTIIHACQQQQPIPLYGDGSQLRNWLYVTDHCRGIDAVLRYADVGETYNIGGHQTLTNLALAQQVCDLMDERIPKHAPHHRLIQFVADRPGHDWRYAMDTSKIQHALAWRPTQDLIDGLQKTIDFYR